MRKLNEKSPYTLFIKVSLIIIIPALIGTLAGKVIDTIFDIAPIGSLISLGFFYILTWVLIYYLYLRQPNPTKN
ncbi:MAG: hypothetical protein KatS3mg085_221 [Candidatus Dojkabacteria bacterium]|nr:MAG: hypothetical protein KatS3mg085_221 [Candidatus Dojkabacteria bacterium]